MRWLAFTTLAKRQRHHRAHASGYVGSRTSSHEITAALLCVKLVIESDGVRHVLHARESAHVPPHVVHQAINNSAEPVEFLVISEPPSHGDRVLS